MREILFRGKSYDSGEWVYGNLRVSRLKDDPTDYVDIYPVNVGYPDFPMAERVYPDTVGQFTGLLDKNGRKIFEGDILNFSIMGDDGYFVVVSMENAAWGFYPAHPGLVHEDDQKWRSFWDPEYDDVWKQIYFTVIGNIYDNQELLGGDNNGVY